MWQLQGRLRGAVLSTAGGDSASSNGLRLQRGKSRSAPPARPPACAALSGSAPWRPRGARGAAGPDRELPGAAMSFCAFRGAERYAGLFDPGIYVCSKCGYELFSSQAKFEHSSPWPAFTKTVHADSVSKYEERPGTLKVSCGKCGNGLGHEFLNDGPKKGQSRF